ncbi:hypothetical protein [Allofournierella sp.]|uniref:hypothetical protein n=1 Tax=Allofournierella sp. TaxID=1940256 RepID=UPI003AB11F92
MKRIKKALAALLALALAAGCAGCGQAPGQSPAPAGSPVTAVFSGGNGRRYYWRGSSDKMEKYTQADYDRMLALKTEGYEQLPLEQFEAAAMKVEDETAYHEAEEAFRRLWNTLPETDPNWGFFSSTVYNTWQACEKKHYNACAHNQDPWYSGWAGYETHGDVFGDDVVLTGAYANFDFTYHPESGAALTVGGRDEALRSIEAGIEAFLKKQGAAALKDEKKMEKALQAELERSLKAWTGGLVWGGQSEVSYDYDQPFGEEDPQKESTLVQSGIAESGWNGEKKYTRAQYDLAVKLLRFENYENMTVAEFNRRVHAAFQQDEFREDYENGLMYAYEIVRATLEETDPNYSFFWDTVPTAENEYDARANSVAWGRDVDPERRDDLSLDVQEDVFGDKVVVGGAQGYYTYTYQLLDANTLTVAQRDAFFKAVESGVRRTVSETLQSGAMSKSEFKKAVEAAGKAASTELVAFTGCEVDYFEIYR